MGRRKRLDIERAKGGSVFRDGRLVDAGVHAEQVENARKVKGFVSARRIPFSRESYEDPHCPACGHSQVLMAMRLPGKFEFICRRCFHIWDGPGQRKDDNHAEKDAESQRRSGTEDAGSGG